MDDVYEILVDSFDFEGGLDWMTKYGLILMNFVMIGAILFAKWMKKRRDSLNPPSNTPTKHILFVIAHPDDESMFFLPTIQAMRDEGCYKLHLLSFSNGGFDGLGKEREKELEKCCKYLGFDFCTTLDDHDIRDGKDSVWPIEKMAGILKEYIVKHDIQGIFTFDDQGVSGHPNHIDVYRSVKLLKQAHADTVKHVKTFKLESVNIIRKYIGVVDIVFCIFSQHVFLNYDPRHAWKAMSIHHSQFVYYRKAFVLFSRYAYINSLTPLE